MVRMQVREPDAVDISERAAGEEASERTASGVQPKAAPRRLNEVA
jgi:hypothetical protein